MYEIKSKFPSYIPIFKNLIGQYLSKFDPREQLKFLSEDIGISTYSLKNPNVCPHFNLDKYAEVQSDVSSAKSMKKVGLVVHETSAFDFNTSSIDYLHPSGNKITLSLVTDIDKKIEYTEEEAMIAAQYLVLLSKTLEEYREKFGTEYRVFDYIEVIQFEKGTLGIRDTNLKNYIFPVFMQVIFNN